MTTISGVNIRDGAGWRRGVDVIVEGNQITEISEPTGREGARTLCPGPIDLQVNGGGGLMLGECRTSDDLIRIAAAHQQLGTAAILPTLISDTPEETARIIDLVASTDDPAILGLHLEGPHLALPGAHDPAHLRPMEAEDLALYLDAKARVGHLIVTLAPEKVTFEQIGTLVEAGVIVSLGHSNCDYDTACAAFEAGARMATHLFNAMSGLHHRAPGLLGAALDKAPSFGLIADGHHVHGAGLRLAFRARAEALVLVSDAMAVAGTDAQEFTLNGRRIAREDGRLMLEDGTLAGADLSLLDGVRYFAEAVGLPLVEALPFAFDAPHRVLMGEPNVLKVGDQASFLVVEGQAVRPFDPSMAEAGRRRRQ